MVVREVLPILVVHPSVRLKAGVLREDAFVAGRPFRDGVVREGFVDRLLRVAGRDQDLIARLNPLADLLDRAAIKDLPRAVLAALVR